MAANDGMSLRMCVLTLVTVCVVFLSVEVGRAGAQQTNSCPASTVTNMEGQLTRCIGLAQDPKRTDPCCAALQMVHDKMHPSPECICAVLTSALMSAVKLTEVEGKRYIALCVDPSFVPKGC